MGITGTSATQEASDLVVMAKIFYLLNCRSLSGSILRIGLFSNRYIFTGIGVVLMLQAMFIYMPFMHAIFASQPLSAQELLLATGVAVLIMPVIGLEKWLRERMAVAERKAG